MSKLVIVLVIYVAMCVKAEAETGSGFPDFEFEDMSKKFTGDFPSWDNIKQPLAPKFPSSVVAPDAVKNFDGDDTEKSESGPGFFPDFVSHDDITPRFAREFPSWKDSWEDSWDNIQAPTPVRPLKSAEEIKNLDGGEGAVVHGTFHSSHSHKKVVDGKTVEDEFDGRDVTNDDGKIKDVSY